LPHNHILENRREEKERQKMKGQYQKALLVVASLVAPSPKLVSSFAPLHVSSRVVVSQRCSNCNNSNSNIRTSSILYGVNGINQQDDYEKGVQNILPKENNGTLNGKSPFDDVATSISNTAAVQSFPDLNENPTAEVSATLDQNTPKVLNLFLLMACFGFAAYSIFDVDHGMTRGWTVAEKAMRIPLDNWSSYESSLNSQPIFTKTLINIIIYTLGDWLSQTVFVNKNLLEFDATRTMKNGLIGLFFGPLVHEYYEFSDTILPVEVGMNRLYKILMDQTIYISVKCSIYIVAVNLLAGESLETGVENVRDKLKDIMFTAWKFWPLVHCVTYGVIPARHRILWVNCVDLIWNAILALKTRGDPTDENVEKIETATIEDNSHFHLLEFAMLAEKNTQEQLDDSIIKSEILQEAAAATLQEQEDQVANNKSINDENGSKEIKTKDLNGSTFSKEESKLVGVTPQPKEPILQSENSIDDIVNIDIRQNRKRIKEESQIERTLIEPVSTSSSEGKVQSS
jgi:protein Mpv17